MIYILFGNQSLMINNRLSKLVKERLETVDAFNYVRFDGRETLIQDIVYECSLIPLGYERKAVVVDNAYFLIKGGEKEKVEKEQDFKCLVAYLKEPNEQSDLFLCVTNQTIDDKSEIVKLVKQNGTIYELADISKENWPEYVRRYFDKLETKIDIDAVTELIVRVQGDANTFVSEANKLSLYTNHVRLEDVLLFIERPLEENAFAISNALIKGKNDVALSIFRDLLVQNEEPVRLISLLSNQFRLMSEVLYLYSLGLSNSTIASQLGVNEYRVKLAVDARRNISYEKLLIYLDKLYKLDYNIKSGQIDRFYAFEMFLADF